jgi:hypothetical protein
MDVRGGLRRDFCVVAAWLAAVAFAVTGGVGGLIVMLHLNR